MITRKTLRWSILLPVVGGVLAAVAALFYRSPSPPVLPQSIGGLALAHQLNGERANEILNRMHDKEVTPATNLIGMYAGGNTSAVVYVSAYRSDDEARDAYATMAWRISVGNPIFAEYSTIRIENHDASFCIGQGQVHYFFPHDHLLYWLSLDPTIAETTARGFIAGLQ